MSHQPPNHRMLKSGHAVNRLSLVGSSPIRPRSAATVEDILGRKSKIKPQATKP
jgi:hypothetical protein